MADVAPLAISIGRGQDRTYSCTHQTSGSDATAINITGWTISATAKDDSGTVVLSKAGTVTNGAAGTYTWAVTASDTLLTPAAYRLDIYRTDSGSRTLMGLGTWTVTSEVKY